MRAIHGITLGAAVSILVTSSSSWAQKPPPPPPAAPGAGAGTTLCWATTTRWRPYPPPPYGAPPPYYGPPPQGSYGYGPPPVRIPYRDGESHPGYHIEENPRKGLVISGAIRVRRTVLFLRDGGALELEQRR